MAGGRIGEGCAGDLDRVHHAHRSVEPSTLGLGVGMRTEQECRAGVGGAAEHVADPVDLGIETRLGHPIAEPRPSRHVLG
jgi:hypothetical protein